MQLSSPGKQRFKARAGKLFATRMMRETETCAAPRDGRVFVKIHGTEGASCALCIPQLEIDMPESDQKLSRRKVVAGVGTAGALAAVAAAVPMSRSEAPSVAAARSTAERGEESGYRLTDHVKNYYRTARV